MSKPMCALCKFGVFKEHRSSSYPAHVECHRLPPAPTSIGLAQFPRLEPTQWCGEYIPTELIPDLELEPVDKDNLEYQAKDWEQLETEQLSNIINKGEQ